KTLDTSGGAADAGAAFKARLSALVPSVKAAIAAGGPSALDIKLKVSEAGVFATKKNFDQANLLLNEVEERLRDSEIGGKLEGMRGSLEKAKARWDAGVSAAGTSARPAIGVLTGRYASGVAQMQNILNSYRDELTTLLDDATAAQDQPAASSAAQSIRDKIRSLRQE